MMQQGMRWTEIAGVVAVVGVLTIGHWLPDAMRIVAWSTARLGLSSSGALGISQVSLLVHPIATIDGSIGRSLNQMVSTLIP